MDTLIGKPPYWNGIAQNYNYFFCPSVPHTEHHSTVPSVSVSGTTQRNPTQQTMLKMKKRMGKRMRNMRSILAVRTFSLWKLRFCFGRFSAETQVLTSTNLMKSFHQLHHFLLHFKTFTLFLDPRRNSIWLSDILQRNLGNLNCEFGSFIIIMMNCAKICFNSHFLL